MAIYIYVPGVVYVKGSNDVYPHTTKREDHEQTFRIIRDFSEFPEAYVFNVNNFKLAECKFTRKW